MSPLTEVTPRHILFPKVLQQNVSRFNFLKHFKHNRLLVTSKRTVVRLSHDEASLTVKCSD